MWVEGCAMTDSGTITIGRRLGARLLIVIPLIISVVWCGLWFGASRLSVGYLQSWNNREEALGRTWSCENIQTGGFPFSFTLTCLKPALKANLKSGPINAAFGEFKAFWTPLHPLSAEVHILGPMQFETTGAPRKVIAKWDEFLINLNSGLVSPPLATIAARKIDLKITTPAGEVISVFFGKTNVELIPSKSDQGAESLRAIASGEEIDSPVLNHMAGNPELGSFKAAFNIEKFDHLKRGDMFARLESWRGANGLLAISELKFAKGRLVLEANGTIRLDRLRRPEGQLQTRTAGLSSLFERLGIPALGGPRGGLLGGLFRKQGAPANQLDDPSSRFIPLPLTLRDGFVWVGPLRTPVALPPVL